MISINRRTIRETFDFGFEEMELNTLTSDEKYLFHRADFEPGGKMEKFFDYPIAKFDKEFCGSVCFR